MWVITVCAPTEVGAKLMLPATRDVEVMCPIFEKGRLSSCIFRKKREELHFAVFRMHTEPVDGALTVKKGHGSP